MTPAGKWFASLRWVRVQGFKVSVSHGPANGVALSRRRIGVYHLGDYDIANSILMHEYGHQLLDHLSRARSESAGRTRMAAICDELQAWDTGARYWPVEFMPDAEKLAKFKQFALRSYGYGGI